MDLESFFPYRLAVTAEGFSRNLVDVYGRTYGLSREEWRLMFILAGIGRITSVELARRTTLGKVQITRASQRLEEKGLITREVPGSDRRLREYEITAAGRALFAEVLPRVRTRADTILGRMSEGDRAALEQGLTALLQAVRATDGAPAGEAGLMTGEIE
jgi:DNA-binding MarR family transcriptional regulator